MAALTATANPTTWTKYNSYVDKTAARTFTCVNQLQINQGQGYCATLAKVVAFVLCAIPLLCVVPVVALWRWVAGTTPPTTQPAVTQPPPQPPRPLPNPAPPAPAVDAPSVETQQLVAAVAQLSATVGGLTHPANRPPEPTPPRVQEIAETMVRGSIAQWRAHPNAENAEALLRFNVDPNISLPTDLQREFDACKAEARATQAGAGLAASAAAASAARNVLTTEELQRFAGDPATIPWREALRGAFQESQGEMTEEKVRAVVAEWTTDALKASMLLVCAANNREKYPALSRDLLYASGAAEERVARSWVLGVAPLFIVAGSHPREKVVPAAKTCLQTRDHPILRIDVSKLGVGGNKIPDLHLGKVVDRRQGEANKSEKHGNFIHLFLYKLLEILCWQMSLSCRCILSWSRG